MGVVTLEQRGPVSVIAINRPEKRNALNKQAALEVQAAFMAFEGSGQRVAVLTGTGNEAFCAGADVTDMPEFWRCCPGVGFECTKPIVAAVSGWCIGGGLVMAMLADLMVASTTARFSYPEAKVGYTSGIGSGLAARIPHKIAMELLLRMLRESFDCAEGTEAFMQKRPPRFRGE
jgi:enoyl-CoA hydratase/carnithine racemase